MVLVTGADIFFLLGAAASACNGDGEVDTNKVDESATFDKNYIHILLLLYAC